MDLLSTGDLIDLYHTRREQLISLEHDIKHKTNDLLLALDRQDPRLVGIEMELDVMLRAKSRTRDSVLFLEEELSYRMRQDMKQF